LLLPRTRSVARPGCSAPFFMGIRRCLLPLECRLRAADCQRQQRQPFPCNRAPTNDERQVPEPEWSVELTLQPRILGSEIRRIDGRYSRLSVGVLAGPIGLAASSFIVDDPIVSLAQPLTKALVCSDLARSSSGRTVTLCSSRTLLWSLWAARLRGCAGRSAHCPSRCAWGSDLGNILARSAADGALVARRWAGSALGLRRPHHDVRGRCQGLGANPLGGSADICAAFSGRKFRTRCAPWPFGLPTHQSARSTSPSAKRVWLSMSPLAFIP
jgi:hypothetical protein